MAGPEPAPSVAVGATASDRRDQRGDARCLSRPPPTSIRVRGVLDPGWSAWFAGMEVRNDRPGETVVVGPVVDQAALHGLLARIRDLGLPLISVQAKEEEP